MREDKHAGLTYSHTCLGYWHQAGVNAVALQLHLREAPKDGGESVCTSSQQA